MGFPGTNAFQPGADDEQNVYQLQNPDEAFYPQPASVEDLKDMHALSGGDFSPGASPGEQFLAQNDAQATANDAGGFSFIKGPDGKPMSGKKYNAQMEEFNPGLKAEREGIDAQMQRLKGLQSIPTQPSLQGAYNLTQVLGGPKLDYTPPKDPEEVGVDMAKLENAIQSQRRGLTAEQVAAFGKVQSGNAAQARAELTANLMKGRFAQQDKIQQNRIDAAAHAQVLSSIKKDPDSLMLLKKNQAIENAANTLLAPGRKITPEAVMEFQQAVRGNIGAGPGSVGERQGSYIETKGMELQKLLEKYSGHLQDIPQDNEIIKHFMQLARSEQKNARNNQQARLDVLTAGNPGMYARRPDLYAGVQQITNAVKNQYSPEQKDANVAGGIPIQSANAAGKPAQWKKDSSQMTPEQKQQYLKELQGGR